MEMSADDDDDFWADDDFIATIENVVKKAEEASAAKHGGTESTPRLLAIPDNGRINGADGPSSHGGTPQAPEIPSSRPTDGSTAPPPRECDSGTFSRHGEVAVSNYRGTRVIDPPHALGRHEVPRMSVNYQRSSLLGEEGRGYFPNTRQSLHDVSVAVLPQGGAGGVRDDSARYGQFMAEKDRTISVLRSRVQEAEEHLDELRRKAVSQDVSQPAFYQQQLELERLSAQLLFKDHEIIEAQRARSEKEERLKHALAETSSLKEELEKLKKSRQAGTEFKRPGNEGSIDAFGKKVDSCGNAMIVSRENLRNTSGVSEPGGNTTTGLPGNFQKDADENGDLLTTNEVSRITESPKRRTRGNGQGIGMPGRSAEEELPSIEQLKSTSRTSEMYYSLQHLWGLKGVKNDGVSLLSKLYASCGQDLYVLFSTGDAEVVKNLRTTDRRNEGQPESGTISEKLHTALGKVMNRLAQPEIIVAPLLEFCKHENVNIVGSALHILRYILHHDSTCRRNLLLRQKKVGEDKGWYIPKEGGNLQMNYRVIFSSPRIVFHPQAPDSVSEVIPAKTGLPENYADKGEQEPPTASDRLQLPAWEQEAGFGYTKDHAEDLNLFVKWMLHLALTSSSPNVKFEAIANIGVLVINSEPLLERSMFGPLLCHGAMDVLMKESLSADIQLQAVRIVHLLLHCPTIMQRFCVEDGGPKFVGEGDAQLCLHFENQTSKSPDNNHEQGISGGQTLEKSDSAVCSAPQQSYYAALSRAKLLEGLTECLKHTDNSPQGYALHRSVIRLLTFIVAFGDSGAAVLMQAGVSCERLESGKKCKDDSKLEGVPGAESASGQNVVGDGSGLTHLKGQGLGNQGDQVIPRSLGDESVDESDRAPNIPHRLLSLIDFELDIEEKEEWNESSIAEERDHLIREAVTLLCRLSSDTIQSPVVLGHLTGNKERTRLTLCVTNRLLSRKMNCKQSWPGQKQAPPRNSNIAELAFGLRERVLRFLEETSEYPLYN